LLNGNRGKGLTLAFFLTAFCLFAQDNFPKIERLDNRDAFFKQYIDDVQHNRRRLAAVVVPNMVEYLTIYQYTARAQDDLFSLAARCNVPYSALASLNRISGPSRIDTGQILLLPTCPGIYIPFVPENDLEKLLVAGHSTNKKAVAISLDIKGEALKYYFIAGDDFTQTERVWFLNSAFRFPLKSFRVTSDFGLRLSPISGNTTMHQGMDLAAPPGTEVFAVADGTVIESGENAVLGKFIIIKHSDKWTSVYGHLQSIETGLLAFVKSGSLIGRVGSTGQSTGPHLHFELRQDGKAFNPSGKLRP
jgi:murein DD-endopeptidase MepM/ murein hydrolase activator NlpD